MTTATLLVASVVIAACSVDGTPVPVGPEVSGHPTIPDTDVAAATAPGARALMARIRATDPCLGLDQTYPARFGSVVRETQQKAQDLTACQVVVSGTPGTPQVRFRVTLGTDLSGQTRGGMTAEQSGSHTIYREPSRTPNPIRAPIEFRSRTVVSARRWRPPDSSTDEVRIKPRGRRRAPP